MHVFETVRTIAPILNIIVIAYAAKSLLQLRHRTKDIQRIMGPNLNSTKLNEKNMKEKKIVKISKLQFVTKTKVKPKFLDGKFWSKFLDKRVF